MPAWRRLLDDAWQEIRSLVRFEVSERPMAPLIDRSVVMRDGRVVYDGPPLTQEGAAHTHDGHHDHHDTHEHGHDHAPHVASPLDFERRTRG